MNPSIDPEKEPAVDTPAASESQSRFVSLVEAHQRLLRKVCWAYAATAHDRDDLFQEIVGRLWKAFGRYDPNRKFSTWMYRVALNVAIDFRRAQTRLWKHESHLEDAQDPSDVADAADAELLRDLRELLDAQSEADRAILLLYLEGNSYREIAEVFGISESNAGTRLNRLKESLRQSVRSQENSTEE